MKRTKVNFIKDLLGDNDEMVIENRIGKEPYYMEGDIFSVDTKTKRYTFNVKELEEQGIITTEIIESTN